MVAVAPTGSSPAPADGVSADEAGEAPAPARVRHQLREAREHDDGSSSTWSFYSSKKCWLAWKI